MIAFICLFFPAVLSVSVYEKLSKRDLKRKQWMYQYVQAVLLINFACFFVKTALTGSGEVPIYDIYTDMLPERMVNYLTMAIPLAVALGVMQVLLSRNVKVVVEEVENV